MASLSKISFSSVKSHTLMVGVWIFVLLGASGKLFAKSQLEAKEAGVKVLAAADKGAAVVKELAKGEVVDSDDRSGMYWKVTLPGGVTGFVSVMQVKRKSVETDDKLAAELRKNVQEQANDESNARARSAVMGVRGLDESKDVEFIGNVKPNLRSVYQMESLIVDKTQLQTVEEQVFAEIEKNQIKK